ncbi:MAG: kynureninase, partial [Acidobacteriota bacterium]|nr:kynureninase [Acidobacteriota bacterium]
CTGGSVKWLCGGAGAGYLYVHPRWHTQLEPKMTGWMGHVAPFAFELPPITYAPGITRFLHGSPNIPALYAARPGYRVINEIGVASIRAKSVRQTQKLIGLCEEAGFKVTSPRDPERRGGTITVAVEHAGAVTKELVRREIICDYRPGAGVRLSPHFYTKDEELDYAVTEMRRIVETRAYTAHEAAGAAF